MNLVADPIPNIRFNVAKALEMIAVTVSTDAEGQELAARKVVPALEKLAGDSDPDVRCESLPRLDLLPPAHEADQDHRLTPSVFASRALEKTTGVEPMSGESSRLDHDSLYFPTST